MKLQNYALHDWLRHLHESGQPIQIRTVNDELYTGILLNLGPDVLRLGRHKLITLSSIVAITLPLTLETPDDNRSGS